MPPVLKIGQLAQATDVSAKTIRYYEQVGVPPPANRTAAGYRLYAEQGLHRLLFVRRARTLGLSLQGLKSLTAALDDGPRATVRPRLLGLVREQLSAVRQQISDLHLFQQQLEEVVQRLLVEQGGEGGTPAPRGSTRAKRLRKAEVLPGIARYVVCPASAAREFTRRA